MRKLETKKAYFYPIKDRDGSPLELMNVLTYVKNDEGNMAFFYALWDEISTLLQGFFLCLLASSSLSLLHQRTAN